jgi:tetratricopeptide (TPR) repeat protein
VATQPTTAIEVFYSYSHKDEELRDQLENHLTMLKRKGTIEGWHDRRISAGREWEGQIDQHLNSAKIILLLVSSDFLASHYCYDVEVERAMQRHESGQARVIPIILRPCDWQSAPFGKLNSLPTDVKPVTRWDDRDEAFLNIAEGIRKAIEDIKIEQETNTSHPPENIKPKPRLYIPDILRVEFVPRKDQNGDIVARLKEELAPHKRRLVALWGAGGVGKTALAIETARGLTEAFEQRVVWVSADGLKDFNLSTLLDAAASQLGENDLRKLALEPKKEQMREVVSAAPTLIVLDNFETIEPEEGKQCAGWLAQPALCSALITTRDIIENAARNIPVKTMLPDEAHSLLQQLIAQAHEPRAFARLDLDNLIQTAEANPLVLQWIVGQIDLAQDPQEVLDDLRHGEGTAAERVFDRSFRLKQLDNGGRAVLLALSLFAPSATRKALAAVSGLDKEKDRKRFKDAVRNLSALWLIRTAEDSPRLAVEGLTRELTKAHLSADVRDKTFCQRFTARFLKYAEANENPTPEHLNALEEEKDNILSAMDVAFNLKDWSSVIQLMGAINFDGVNGLLTVRGYWDEAIQRGEQAITAAHNLQNEVTIARLSNNIAIILQNRGELDEARRLFNESLKIKKRFSDQSGIASTLHNLAVIAQAQGELEEARRLYDESLEICKRFGDQRGVASTLRALGSLSQNQGELEEARRLYDESLDITERLGNQSGMATTLHALGSLAQDQGELDKARRLYNESLEIKKRLGDQSGIAAGLHQLGTVCLDEGNFEETENLLNQSLTILRRLNHKQHIAECLESIGRLKTAQGLFAEAHEMFNESLDMALSLCHKLRVASVKRSLGLLAEKENKRAKTAELLREALSGFQSLKSPKAEDTLRDLERLESESA